MITGKTRLFLLLGRPVAHSLSPAMQNAAFQVLGLDAVYAAADCAPEATASMARAVAAAGGGGNATVPHKLDLAAALDRPSHRVKQLGSANAFWGEEGELAGENTDIDGVLEALKALGALEVRTWLVLGTGGSARAVVGAAAQLGARVAIRSREAGRGASLQMWASTLGVHGVEPGECQLVINATPLGLTAADPLPIAPADLPNATAALDLVYARGETPWVRVCRARGLKAADGREMLVAQGAVAFEKWFPKLKAPREVMRAAVARALA